MISPPVILSEAEGSQASLSATLPTNPVGTGGPFGEPGAGGISPQRPDSVRRRRIHLPPKRNAVGRVFTEGAPPHLPNEIYPVVSPVHLLDDMSGITL